MEQRHLYHLVSESPWPVLTAFSVQGMLLGAVMYMQNIHTGLFVLVIGLLLTFACAMSWWTDVIYEGLVLGDHTKIVQRGLRIGMVLFIISEVMFFFAFFWAYFHSSLAPTIEIGSIWPPTGLHVLNPGHVPYINTIILLLSGATITWAHHAIVCGDFFEARKAFDATILLAMAFTALQGLEYMVPWVSCDYWNVIYFCL
jgi:cytochrome c oxidase subunit 3